MLKKKLFLYLSSWHCNPDNDIILLSGYILRSKTRILTVSSASTKFLFKSMPFDKKSSLKLLYSVL